MTTITRRDGVAEGLAFKRPVKCATTANITLSGEQTLDGILTSASRVLVKNQTDTTANGLYDSGSGAWTRCLDFDGSTDFTTGTQVVVQSGTVSAGLAYHCTVSADPPVVGTSTITWAASAGTTSTGSQTVTAGTGITVSGGAGSTPTVSITATGVTPATYGSATLIPVLAINAQGQVTSASSTAVSGTAAGDLQIGAFSAVFTTVGITDPAAPATGKLALYAKPNGATQNLYVKDHAGTVTNLFAAAGGGAVDLTSGVTGTLPVANGGSGAATLTDGGVLLGSGTAAVTPTAAFTNGQILVGVTGADPAPVTMSGDATLATGGALTIAAAAVTLAKMANLAQATIIGRASGAGTGVPTALTAAQAATVIGALTTAGGQTVTGGYIITTNAKGAQGTGGVTFTPVITDGPHQSITLGTGGTTVTIAPPAADGELILKVTNHASGSVAPTLSGFNKHLLVENFSTGASKVNWIYIWVIDGFSAYTIRNMN